MDLLVIAKEPVPGRAKTRLTPPCHPVDAAAIAAGALADTLAAALASGADRVLVALDGQPGPWLPPGAIVVSQGQGDLATRLATAWSATTGPALQIGMDTPQVGADGLADAMRAMTEDDEVDALFGPATDGGWWALGLRRRAPMAFAGIATSRPDTGVRQLERLLELGLRTALLPEQRDVDTWPDAVAVAAGCPGGAFAAAVAAAGASAPEPSGARR